MVQKIFITIGMIAGSYIGGWIPTLFGAQMLSGWGILGTTVGGILGVWAGFKVGKWVE